MQQFRQWFYQERFGAPAAPREMQNMYAASFFGFGFACRAAPDAKHLPYGVAVIRRIVFVAITLLPSPRTSRMRTVPDSRGASTFIFRISFITSGMRAIGIGSVSRTLQSGSSPSVTRTLLARVLLGSVIS